MKRSAAKSLDLKAPLTSRLSTMSTGAANLVARRDQIGSTRVDILSDGRRRARRPLARDRVAERNGPYGRIMMPEKRTIAKARKDKRAGKAPTTQAGEFVHEEIRDPPGRTRGAVAAAGYRNRPVQVEARRRCPSPAAERSGQGAHAPKRRICLCRGPAQAQSPSPAARLARRIAGSEARTAPHRVAACACPPSQTRRRAPFRGCAISCGAQIHADERLCRPLRRST